MRAIFVVALGLGAQALAAAPRVIAVDVHGMVHPITAEIVGHALARARDENAALVLVRLNTPGGLMDAMRVTIERMLSQGIPVVTYVAPRWRYTRSRCARRFWQAWPIRISRWCCW